MKMKEKVAVVVGRKWNSPNIQVVVTKEEIGIQISMEDFLHALALEAGNPAFLLTVKGLEKRLVAAADVVVAGMKDETARVM